MRLVEQGRLDLGIPVLEYLPDLRLADPNVSARVTLRHLLTHTAGFVGDDFTDTGRGDDALARYVDRMTELPHAEFAQLWALFALMLLHTAQDVVQDLFGLNYVRALVQHDTLGAIRHRCVSDLGS